MASRAAGPEVLRQTHRASDADALARDERTKDAELIDSGANEDMLTHVSIERDAQEGADQEIGVEHRELDAAACSKTRPDKRASSDSEDFAGNSVLRVASASTSAWRGRGALAQLRIVRSLTPSAWAAATWVMPAPSISAAARRRSRRKRRLSAALAAASALAVSALAASAASLAAARSPASEGR